MGIKNLSFLKQIVFIVGLLIFTSCKSAKPIMSSSKANKEVTAKQLINTYDEKLTKFNTLNGRIGIDYQKGKDKKSVGVSFRMEKDKHIWMSAPFGFGKALITPSRVAFYNKLDKEYFDGDFSYLSNLLGTEIDFQKLQNILLGQAIYDLNKQSYRISVRQNSYLLTPKRQNTLFNLEYLINPTYFKLDELSITQKMEQKKLNVRYNSYQNLQKLVVPKLISIIANDDRESVIINLEFKSLRLNEKLRFPFKIPDGYKEFKF